MTRIELAASSRLAWREEIVLGRHGEVVPGSWLSRLEILGAGRPLLVAELALGPAAPAWPSPAVLDGARAVRAGGRPSPVGKRASPQSNRVPCLCPGDAPPARGSGPGGARLGRRPRFVPAASQPAPRAGRWRRPRRDGLAVVTGSAYDDFAADYHWIFSDEHVSGEQFLRRYRDVLAALPARAEVLDCACGTGLEALTLARNGFRVTACDASEGMVAEARRLFADSGVEVPVEPCTWDRLPSSFPARFDAVFCTGNSISHAGRGSRDVGGPRRHGSSSSKRRRARHRGAGLGADVRGTAEVRGSRSRGRPRRRARVGAVRVDDPRGMG